MLDAAVVVAETALTADDSFDQTVRARSPQILRTAYRILGNWADAEDVAQETFVRLHRHGLRTFANEAALASWLYRVAVNLCLDSRRRRRASGELPELPSVEASAEAVAIREEQKERLMQALAKLPPKERAAVVLREIEGLSSAEVAEVLGSSEGTVRSQVFKAIGRLRRILIGEER